MGIAIKFLVCVFFLEQGVIFQVWDLHKVSINIYSYFEKGHATTPKGIVGGFEFTVFRRIWKNGKRGHGHMSASAKGKQQNSSVRDSILNINLVPRAFPLKNGWGGKALGTRLYWTYPILPLGIVARTFFPTTFLKIASHEGVFRGAKNACVRGYSRNSCKYFYLNPKQGQGLRPCVAHNNPKLMGVPPPGLLSYICHCV